MCRSPSQQTQEFFGSNTCLADNQQRDQSNHQQEVARLDCPFVQHTSQLELSLHAKCLWDVFLYTLLPTSRWHVSLLPCLHCCCPQCQARKRSCLCSSAYSIAYSTSAMFRTGEQQEQEQQQQSISHASGAASLSSQAVPPVSISQPHSTLCRCLLRY